MKKTLSVCLLFLILLSSTGAVFTVDSQAAIGTVNSATADSSSGWVKKSGKWYYYVGNAPVTGWKKVSGSWYYMDSKGVMQTGWKKIDGNWYYFAKGGAMQTGWKKIDGSWYYFAKGGAMKTGWLKLSGKWYFLSSGGAMRTGWQKIDGSWYYFYSSGVMAADTVAYDGETRYYMNKAGHISCRWISSDGNWYCRDNSGTYLTGWQKLGDWYYFDAAGVMQTGWLRQNSKYYYLKDDGAMAVGRYQHNAVVYEFDNKGAWTGYNEVEYDTDNIVVAIDAGHDARHSGASYNGFNEHEMTLDIALAIKAELETYEGVTVVLTRSTNECADPERSNSEELHQRVAGAAEQGAQLFVSCHINAASSPNAAGGPCILPQVPSWKPCLNEECYKLGDLILEELYGLGLGEYHSRYLPLYIDDGTTYIDGSTADYYAINRWSKIYDMVGMIVEHGFIDNSDDMNLMNTESKRQAMGRADATAIAAYLGLKKR